MSETNATNQPAATVDSPFEKAIDGRSVALVCYRAFIMNDEIYEIQVKVPVCVTLRLSKEDAESMYHDELCEVVDAVLEDMEQTMRTPGGLKALDGETCGKRVVSVLSKITPHWDHLPVDDCELTLTYDGLFPERD